MTRTKKALFKPPDIRADHSELVKNSKRDLDELFEKSSPLDKLAGLAQALKKAKGKK